MYDRARQSHFNAVNMHSCPLRITNVRGWWVFSLSIFFAVHLFWKKKSEAIMRINQVFLYSKSFCSSLILLWMRAHTHTHMHKHTQTKRKNSLLFIFLQEQASGVVCKAPQHQLSLSPYEALRPLLRQVFAGGQCLPHAGCCCSRIWADEHWPR